MSIIKCLKYIKYCFKEASLLFRRPEKMLQMSAKAYHKKMKGCWVTLNILSVFIEENTNIHVCIFISLIYVPKISNSYSVL